jgi:hypothetical protein
LDDRSTVLNLPKGATSLDAAFALHSDVGLTLAAAHINSVQVGFNHKLKNGDVVSFQSSPDKGVTVKPAWLDMAETSGAQGRIRKYLRDHHRGMLVCIGCVKLLFSMTLSTNAMEGRFPQGLPDASKLARWAKSRSTNLYELLIKLGTAKRPETAALIGGLLDIPKENVTVSTITLGVLWARMQERNGWEDKALQRDILLPLMKEVLPPLLLGVEGVDVEAMWVQLVGERSLRLEEEPVAVAAVAAAGVKMGAVHTQAAVAGQVAVAVAGQVVREEGYGEGHELVLSHQQVVVQAQAPVTPLTPLTPLTLLTHLTPRPLATKRARPHSLRMGLVAPAEPEPTQSPVKTRDGSDETDSAHDQAHGEAHKRSHRSSLTPFQSHVQAVVDDLFTLSSSAHPTPEDSDETDEADQYGAHTALTVAHSLQALLTPPGRVSHTIPHRPMKSHVTLLRRPYALEAPSLSVPLLKMARKTYGQRENAKARLV